MAEASVVLVVAQMHEGMARAGWDERVMQRPMSEAAVTPPEYLAGLAQGHADRDGEVALLNATIRELRTVLGNLAEAVIESVTSCDGVVSIAADHYARLALEEILPDMAAD